MDWSTQLRRFTRGQTRVPGTRFGKKIPGFVAFQSVQNVAFKSGTAWLDPAEGPEPVKEALPADPQASFS